MKNYKGKNRNFSGKAKGKADDIKKPTGHKPDDMKEKTDGLESKPEKFKNKARHSTARQKKGR